MFWSHNIEVHIISSSLNFIHASITFKEIKESFECSFVYGNPPSNRSFPSNRNVPWCFIGDFNEMLSMHDKEGGRMIHQNWVDLFRDFLDGQVLWILN